MKNWEIMKNFLSSLRISKLNCDPEFNVSMSFVETYLSFHIISSSSSYLHCEWATAEKLARGDKRIHMKIKRYKAKQNAVAFFSEV